MGNIRETLNIITYLTLAVSIMGLIGSVLQIIIFSRKVFNKNSIGVYGRFLAIFDILIILNSTIEVSSLVENVLAINKYEWVCKLEYYYESSISPLPGWILVFLSIDQFITISRTERFSFFKKKCFQYSLILTVFIFHCGVYIPVILSTEIQNISSSGNASAFECLPTSLILPIFYLFDSSLIPFISMVITTCLILRALFRYRSRIYLKTMPSTLRVKRVRDIKLAFNSVVLNILFILLSSPLVVYNLYPKNLLPDIADFFESLAILAFYLNFSLHFWVHLCVYSVFRNEFLIVLNLKNRPE